VQNCAGRQGLRPDDRRPEGPRGEQEADDFGAVEMIQSHPGVGADV